jgi:hypothetical protein
MDESTIEIEERAESYRRSVLESSDDSLKSALERTIVRGVVSGLVRIDDGSALPIASTLTPSPGALPRNASWSEREAWSAHPYFREAKAVRELEYALKCPGGAEAALRALGHSLEPAGVYDVMLAMWLVRDLSPIANGAAPSVVLARMKDTLTSFARAVEGPKTWASALKNAFLMLKAFGEGQTAREQVDVILDMLRASTTDLPGPFRNPTEAHLSAATRVLENLASVRRTGPPKQRWGNARDFAHAFGVNMPERERDAKPRKGL